MRKPNEPWKYLIIMYMENKHVMNWVTIDIGAADVKASVWNKNDEPVRLAYPMGNYTTTQLPAAVVVTENGDVVAGDNVQLFSILYPDRLISDWMKNMRYKEKVAESLLGMVRQAAVGHYGNANVGAVILFEDGEENIRRSPIFLRAQSDCKNHFSNGRLLDVDCGFCRNGIENIRCRERDVIVFFTESGFVIFEY